MKNHIIIIATCLVLAFIAGCTQTSSPLLDGIGDGVVSEQEQAVFDAAVQIYKDQQEKKAEETTTPVVETPVEAPVVIPSTPAPEPVGLTKEVLEVKGWYNIKRPTFYASLNLNQYPNSFWFTVPGFVPRTLVTTNKKRLEYPTYAGWIFKQSDVAYRGMGIIGPEKWQCKTLILEYQK